NNYCLGGTFNFNASSNQGLTACPSGMTSNAGSSAKTACKITCAAGKYLPKNATSCATCPANNYCVGGTFNFNASSNQGITACPSGKKSSEGSTSSSNCKSSQVWGLWGNSYWFDELLVFKTSLGLRQRKTMLYRNQRF
ncbi:MAG: hypothetical protein II567_04220, partial [Candidatus Riflebacteria bacterium]|nr:hypothetical protein [Candidatus Riflebacteria bacterium]